MGINVKEVLGNSYKDDITVAELISLLETSNGVVNQSELQAQIDKNDKLATENAQYRKANKTQEELAKEQLEELQNQNATLAKQLSVIENENQFIAMGYEQSLAHDTAVALVEGNTKKFFKNQQVFNESQEKKYKADVLKETKVPEQTTTEDKTYSRADFKGMSLDEISKFASEHSDEYNNIYNSKGE